MIEAFVGFGIGTLVGYTTTTTIQAEYHRRTDATNR